MVDAAAEFKKSGYSEEDSATLAQISAMYQNVADDAISASDASSFIIAQMKAFNVDASDAISIVDQLNAVSNNYAVSSSELAQGLGIVSSALAIGGNNYQEVLGLMTAGTEITRNATKTARGLVSVQSRLNQITDESSSVGQALSDWYEQHGIDVYDQQTGQIKSLYQILSELAPKWKDLTKNEQAYYLNQQAGANQSQNLAAILQNFEVAVKATGTALEDSLGSALKENEKYMQSLESQTRALKNSFQDFANNVISKDLVSGALTLLNNTLDGINNTAGQSLTQFTLLTTGLTGLAGVAKEFLPALAAGFKSVFTGATVATTGVKGFAAILGSFAPYAAVISGVVIGIYTLVKVLNERKTDINDFTEAIEQNEAKLAENEKRIKEINALGWDDKTPEILAEKDALEKENKALQDQIDLYKESRQTRAQDTLNGIYRAKTTYTTQRVRGEETLVPVTEITKGKEAYRQISNELARYRTILKENKQLTDEEKVAYDKLVAEANRYATAMENVAGGVESCTIEQREMYNTLKTTQAAYDDAVNYIANYVDGLITQAKQTGVAEDKLYDLVAAEITANKQGLDFSQQIAALQQLASQAGLTAAMIQGVTGTSDVDYKRNLAAWKQTINPLTGKTYTEQEAQQKLLSSYWTQLSYQAKKATDDVETTVVTGLGSTTKAAEEAAEDISDAMTEAAQTAEDAWKESLENQKEAIEAAANYMVGKIDEEIDALNEQKDAINKTYDDQIDALQKANDELERQIEYEQLLNNLAKAKDKRLYVFSNGQFQYVQDIEAIDEAQAELDAYNRDKQLQDEVDRLESLRDAAIKNIDLMIADWGKYKDEWESVATQYEEEQNRLLAEQTLGIKLEGDNWKIRLTQAQEFASQYNAIMASLSAGFGGVSGAYGAPATGVAAGAGAVLSGELGLSNTWDMNAPYNPLWEEGVDYTEELRKAIAAGRGPEWIQGVAGQRNAKIKALGLAGQVESTQALWDRLVKEAGYTNGYNASLGAMNRTSTTSASSGAISAKTQSDVMRLEDEILKNSQAWFNASPAEQKRLHDENERLRKQLSNMGYAHGTTSARGGLSLVGEQGPELRVLNSGDGVIPADITRNLWDWGKFNPKSMMSTMSQVFNIDNLTLPNAHDAAGLITGLKQMAYQRAYKRA